MTRPDSPFIVMVAPNGARKTKADHPALPLTPAELARDAAQCLEAGAAAIHVHVRDRDGRHTLDPEAYAAALAAIRLAVGDRLICQVTTEAVGRFTPAEQMAAVRAVRPEAVSLAPRELAPGAGDEAEAARFLAWLAAERVRPQFILYDRADVVRFADWRARGIVVQDRPFLLFVLGRHAGARGARPADLIPFLTAAEPDGLLETPWAVCAFGPREGACSLTAAALGGHSRVGFENNVALATGAAAPDNAALVAQAVAGAALVGRRAATADEARALLG